MLNNIMNGQDCKPVILYTKYKNLELLLKMCLYNIVRIEFPPVVEIGVNKRHYFPQETTNEGPNMTNAWACYNLYCF